MNNPSVFEFRELSCAVCGSTERTHLGWRGGKAHHDHRGERVEIVRCRTCTHIYPHPMPYPAGTVGDLYDDPDEYFSAHDVEVKKRQGSDLMKIVEDKLGRKGTMLDVGCGRGELLWAARDANWNYTGVDPSSAHLEWGRVNLDVQGLLGTIETASLPAESFDVVIMGGVIEHLYDPFATLQEVRRVLKPGGLFYLDAPNEDALYTQIGNLYLRALRRDWVVNLAPTFPPYHVQGFNPNSLRRLLERAGFQVEDLHVWGQVSPLTGKMSLRKRLEYRGAQLINWIGNRRGNGIYMDGWARKSTDS
jgi:SAM-dependent methyltransferase